jgi:uncharacterized beta-barrel protein YwiB (DUF1934 family)
MKDVIISIIGTQADPAGDNDTIELVTDGKYLFENGQGSLTYMESELTGLAGTKTTFMTDKYGIVMLREGSLNSRMVFEEGKKHHFLYDTPFGAATMGVNTSKAKSLLGEHGGDMEIDYVIDFDHSIVGRNSFKINIREQGKAAKCQI